MRMSTVAVVAASVVSWNAAAAESGALVGVWMTENSDSKIRMSPCGKGFCGTVVWAKTNGLDTNNPDPAMRKRSIIGMPLTTNMKAKRDGGWAGSIYNPEDGKTYAITMQPKNANQLEVEGCVMGVLCGAEAWSRQPEETASAAPALAPRP